MRPLTVPDAENVILALQDEIRRSDESRYDHRHHGLLLVAQWMTGPQVGRMAGYSTRTVQCCAVRFDEEGLSGRAGGDRSATLSDLRSASCDLWSGLTTHSRECRTPRDSLVGQDPLRLPRTTIRGRPRGPAVPAHVPRAGLPAPQSPTDARFGEIPSLRRGATNSKR